MARLSKVISDAVKSGPVPKMRSVDAMVENPRTTGEKVVAFAFKYLVVPDGILVGEPLRLEPFQIAFILAVFDNPHRTRHAYLSVARRNGKTFVVAVILAAYLVGPLAEQNKTLAAAAMSRDQAAITFNLLSRMLDMSPKLAGLYRSVPSTKKIHGLVRNTEFNALASDAKTGFGRGLKLILLDEAGQIKGPQSDFADMLTTSQGSETDPLMITISTQAPSDGDYLSIHLDAAEREHMPNVVSHVYSAEPDCDILDEKQWARANPGLGVFRGRDDLAEQLNEAVMIPSKQAGAMNLLLNMRISRDQLFMAPTVWKKCGDAVDGDAFRKAPVVAMGLDLSARHDLTAACLAAFHDGKVHLKPYVFCPSVGIDERSRRDRAPYDQWVRDGYMIPLAGESMDYKQIAEYLRDDLDDQGITVTSIEFDRWRIEAFKAMADEVGFCPFATWNPVGQGYKDFSPRCEAFQNAMLKGTVAHGSHPLLNMAAANAVAVLDPTGATKLDKSKSTNRIDPIIAAIMGLYAVTESGYYTLEQDLSFWVA